MNTHLKFNGGMLLTKITMISEQSISKSSPFLNFFKGFQESNYHHYKRQERDAEIR